MSPKHEPARPRTRTDGSCSSRRVARPRSNAGRCSSRPLCSAPGVSITGWSGRCGDARKVARRYLALEGRRVLAELAAQLPLAAALRPTGEPTTSTADESLAVARGRSRVAAPPEWFGVIRPSRLLGAPAGGPGARPATPIYVCAFDPTDVPETKDDGDARAGRGKQDPQAVREPARLEHPLGLLQQAARQLPFPRRRGCRRRDAGSVDAAGGQRGAERPASPRPSPLHHPRHARLCRWRGWRPLPGVGCTQQPVPAGALPGHRLPTERYPRRL